MTAAFDGGRARVRPRPGDRAPRAWRAAAALAAVVALAGGACSDARAQAPLPSSPPVVVVTMHEYRFDYEAKIPWGRVVFRFVNAGQAEHRPSLLPLDDDFPPIDEQLRGAERRVVTPFGGVDSLSPGETSSFAVDLAPNRRYAIVSFTIQEGEQSDALKGMSTEFRTPPPPPPPPPPPKAKP